MQFIPSKVDFSPESEKLWQGNLGMVAYEDNVVFTKASLIQFLKLHDICVDPNGTELKKLPKFARFGRLAASGPQQEETAGKAAPAQAASAEAPAQIEPERAAAQTEAPQGTEVILPNGEVFRPTRKVRELPGGGSSQIASLFGGNEEEEDVKPPFKPAAINNPVPEPNPSPAPAPSPPKSTQEREPPSVQQEQQRNTFRPTRKVRELPGGGSSQISALFGGGDD